MAVNPPLSPQNNDSSTRSRLEEQPDFPAVLLSAMQDALFAADDAMRLTFLSPAAERMFGWNASDVRGQPASVLFQEDPIPTARAARSFAGEVICCRRDGFCFPAYVRAAALLTPEGEFLGLVVTVQDLTERKKAEARLLAAAARDAYRVQLTDNLRPLADPLRIVATVTRLLGEHLRANHACYAEFHADENILDVHADYCIASFTSLVGQHRLDTVGDFLTKSLRGGRTLAISTVAELPYLSPTGMAALLNAGIQAMIIVPLIRHGRLSAALAVFQSEPRAWSVDEVALIEETAERAWAAVDWVQAEADLRRSERVRMEANERFRSSIETINEAFFILSAVREGGAIVDFCVEFANQAVCDAIERRLEEVVGQKILDLLPAHRANGLFDLYCEVIQSGRPRAVQAEFSGERKSGIPVVAGTFAVRAAKYGDGVIVIANDISEQLRLQAEYFDAIKEREIHHRLATQRELERQSYARDIHDGPIQTLSSLAFNLQLIKETFPDPALIQELDKVNAGLKGAVQELRQVINELRPPSVIRFGLAKAIQSHVEGLRVRYPQIEWHLRLARDAEILPEQTCLALFRIYQEAINNITRHSAASKAWITYRVFREHITLEIRDNGRGFDSSQDIAQLTTQQHFGLAGISERVDAVKGQFKISSIPGRGVTLKVRAPIKQEDLPNVVPPSK